MAWLARSITNSLKLGEGGGDVGQPGDDESAQNQSEWRRVYVMQHIEMASRASEVIAFVTEWPAALSLEACVNVLRSFRCEPKETGKIRDSLVMGPHNNKKKGGSKFIKNIS
ncbi:hypothetical protein Bca52824_032928 [Brassica carinata]|uniref:Uncharacterized protein n=1 Tax=Brassica carinata TaxID=52824 RepID=A0A8X7V6S6_BRACI|nr:hypothetical protein Bca52824_032928 [Brassica carinata]